MWSIDVRGLVRNKLNISKEYHFDPYYIDSLPYYEYEWIIEEINETHKKEEEERKKQEKSSGNTYKPPKMPTFSAPKMPTISMPHF